MNAVLDIEQPETLIAYLKTNGYIAPDEYPQSRVLTGGVSNRTVLLKRDSGEAWVIKQALGKLRVQSDWFSDPRRIHQEALGLRWLSVLLPAGSVPAVVFEDTEAHLLAMQAIPEPHHNWKTLLLAGKIDFDHIRQFGELLAIMARRAFEQRAAIAPDFADRSFFESLRIEAYYRHSAVTCAEAAGFIDALVDETHNTVITLTHGDYSPKNVLVYQNRLILLDHEVMHFGDPAFDLGFSMTHLLSKAHHVKAFRPQFAEATKQYWRIYRQKLGDLPWTAGLEARAVRHTLGCLLARVAGKSPLEYLTAEERINQQTCVLRLMADLPLTVPDLVDGFIEGLAE